MSGEGTLSRRQFAVALAGASLAAGALAGERLEPRSGRAVGKAARIKAHSFPMSQVRLLSGTCYTLPDRNRIYLHTLDSDRLLHTFRLTAGLASKAQQLGGRECPTSSCAGISWATTCRRAA